MENIANLNDGDLLLAQDVAKVLGLSAVRVRQLETIGKLRAVRTPGGVRVFTRDDVERLRIDREKA